MKSIINFYSFISSRRIRRVICLCNLRSTSYFLFKDAISRVNGQTRPRRSAGVPGTKPLFRLSDILYLDICVLFILSNYHFHGAISTLMLALNNRFIMDLLSLLTPGGLVIVRWYCLFTIKMHCQPNCSLRNTLHRMRHASRQEEVVTGFERHCFVGDFKNCITLQKHNPFILLLYILAGSNGSRTQDSFNNEVLVTQDGLEAFALYRRCSICIQISDSHFSTPLLDE